MENISAVDTNKIKQGIYTPFHAYYKAKKLRSENRLLPTFAAGALDVYPYQVAAASFALESPLGYGVVLADEGSLGKTYEALLIISQKWFEGTQKILIVVPVHLLTQWKAALENNFNIPYSTNDANEEGVFLTTYESEIPDCKWEIACFDEAQRLRNDNETNRCIKSSVTDSYKILLTPAPIMNDIMDLYHLINFIDADEFPDSDEYYNRYFRQEDNYPELAERAGKYIFRTLRSQVSGYVNIPNRLVASVSITPTGLNLEFCSCVINFDMSFNTLDIEQRILRCHRQNQQNDVRVVNFINKQNAADIRALELYKKRIKQFAGIFGISDEIVGNFYDSNGTVEYFTANARDKAAIRQAFKDNLASREKENTAKTDKSKTTLYSTFDENISYSSALTPEYVETKRREMNDDLWYITTALLEGQSGIWLNHETRSIKAMRGINESRLFKDLYIRRDEYSMTDMSLPKSGRYMLTSKLALNVLGHILWHKNFADEGAIYIEDTEPCTIEFYEIEVKKGSHSWNTTSYGFFELVGKTGSGRILNDDECRRIMSMPCFKVTETGRKMTWQERLSYEYPTGDYQSLIDTDKYRDLAVKGAELLEQEILRRIRRDEHNKKAEIERKLKVLMQEKQAIEKQEAQITNVRDRIKLEKKLAVIEDDLRQAERALFMEKMRIEYEAEQEIKKLLDDKEVRVKIKRIFKIKVSSCQCPEGS